MPISIYNINDQIRHSLLIYYYITIYQDDADRDSGRVSRAVLKQLEPAMRTCFEKLHLHYHRVRLEKSEIQTENKDGDVENVENPILQGQIIDGTINISSQIRLIDEIEFDQSEKNRASEFIKWLSLF